MVRALRTLLVLSLALVVSGAVLSGCGKDGPEETTPPPEAGPAMQAEIVVRANKFDPAVTTIGKGGTITWVNRDKIPYALKSPGLFEETLNDGASWSYTFQDAGEYRVYDDLTSIPSEMKVIVK